MSDIQCSLCSNLFADPCLLPCLHVFCRSCLKSLEQETEGRLVCPTCYKPSPYSSTKLPTHIRVDKNVKLKELQESNAIIICATCEIGNEAESFCEDCASTVCSECISTHERLKVWKGHKIVPLDSAKHCSPPVTCSMHSNELIKHYCVTCCNLICNECMINHRHHKFVSIGDAASAEKEKLRSLLPNIKKSLVPINEAIVKMSKTIDTLKYTKNEIETKVNDAFKAAIAALEERHEEVLKEYDDSITAKTTRLEIEKEKLEKYAAGRQLALETTSAACDEFSDVEFLAIQECLHLAFKDISHDDQSLSTLSGNEFVDEESPTFEFNMEELTQVISSFGNIGIFTAHPPLCSLVTVNSRLPIGFASEYECRLPLQTRNSNGEDIAKGGTSIKGKILKPRGNRFVRNCNIRDIDNGRYEITIPPLTPGVYKLYVTIKGTNIRDGPFALKSINYGSLHTTGSIDTSHSPQYVCSFNDSFLFVTTNQGYVEVYSLESKEKVHELPKLGKQLRGIVIDEQNEVIFIAVAGIHKIVKVDLQGKILASVGSKGSHVLQFQYPTGLCLTNEGELIVGDCQNKRIQVLESDLTFNRYIKCHGQVWGVSVDHIGNIHVGTTRSVEVFSVNGDRITEYGKSDLDKAGDIKFPNFQHPSKYSLVTDCIENGNIFLFDWPNDITLCMFEVGDHPLGMHLNQDGTLYVCCYDDDEIQVFN